MLNAEMQKKHLESSTVMSYMEEDFVLIGMLALIANVKWNNVVSIDHVVLIVVSVTVAVMVEVTVVMDMVHPTHHVDTVEVMVEVTEVVMAEVMVAQETDMVDMVEVMVVAVMEADIVLTAVDIVVGLLVLTEEDPALQVEENLIHVLHLQEDKVLKEDLIHVLALVALLVVVQEVPYVVQDPDQVPLVVLSMVMHKQDDQQAFISNTIYSFIASTFNDHSKQESQELLNFVDALGIN
jgi:hypothetical protein